MKIKDRSQIYEFELTGRDIFEDRMERWCPLFGEIPFIFKPEKFMIADRCLDLIIGARRDIYDVPILFNKNGIQLSIEQFEFKKRNWPELEEVPNYPAAYILAARSTALWNHCNIVMHAGDYLANTYGRQEWYDSDAGIFHYARSYMHYGFESPRGIKDEICPLLCYPPGSPEEGELVKYEHNMEVQEKAREVPDSLIFAALAIAEAWSILERVLHDGEREKNKDIQADIIVANKLLEKAYRAKIAVAKKDIEEADRDIDALMQYSESIKKDSIRREASKNTRIARIREHFAKNEPVKQAYVDEAKQVKDKNKEMRPYTIIAVIKRKIALGKVKKELIGRNDSEDTIRRYIEPLFPITPKKPAKKYPQT